MGDLTQIEGIQLTIGNLIGLVGLVVVVGAAVWGVAKIRNSDKEEIEKSHSSAYNRLDKKFTDNVDVLHARVNKLGDEMSDIKYQIGKIEGKQDAG